MADLFDPPFSEMKTDLERLTSLLSLIRNLREFGGSDPPPSNGDGDFGNQSRALRGDIRKLSAELAVLSGTLVLFLAGRFEHFVRAVFQAICDSYATKCQTFDALPEKMQKGLIFHTAEVVQAPAKYGYDSVQALGFIVTLAGNTTALAGLGQINSECLSVTQSNLSSGVLADLYKRIGLGALWSDIGKQAPIKMHFSVANDNDAEASAKGRLDALMTLRNQIAHPSGASSFPDPDQVQEYAEYVKVLGAVITDVSRVYVSAFRGSVSASRSI